VSRIVGIDLGTTNSCVGVIENGRPVLIPNSLGQRLTPSVVRFLPDGAVLVGERAARSRAIDPENTIISVKRLIGRRYNELFDLIPLMPYRVSVGENNLAVIQSRGRTYTPQFVSGLILRSLREDAERYLGESVRKAVICVPAYFDTLQREATRQAGIIAGWNVERIVNEPTAASMLLPDSNVPSETNRVAVCDLGGGTFDVSILEIGFGVNEVCSIAGDNLLGGDDFDDRLVEWMRAECLLRLGRLPTGSLAVGERLRDAAINAKHALSAGAVVDIDVPFLELEDGGYGHLQLSLSRTLFEELCAELFERLREPCEVAIQSLHRADVTSILLVGGATRMSRVSPLVQEVFGCGRVRSIQPDEIVALGAAVEAGVLEGRIKDRLLLDLTSASLGVETSDGRMCKMIERNTTIPTRKSDVFSTSQDNQTSVEIRVLEGERALANDNRTIARLVLDELPPLPRHLREIELTFDIDANHSLTVAALDRDTGKKANLVVKPQTGVSEEQLTVFSRTLPPAREL
jgi:molecular chaperone DnaK